MTITLKAARVNKGITQEELADTLKVSKKTISSWESGKTVPKIDKIQPLCAALEMEYNDIQWTH
jgi:transcriptional regulator with XRE-family HTH domain